MIYPAVVPHCNEEGCDMGSLQYTCPYCHHHNTNYDNWYDMEDHVEIETRCDGCFQPIVLFGFVSDELYITEAYQWGAS